VAGGPLRLILDPTALAVCRLDPADPVPTWIGGSFWSVTRTADELSVICPAAEVPTGVKAESPWRSLRVAGTLDFSMVGVLASLAAPLAQAGISIFVISTFDSDYLLVRSPDLGQTIAALAAAGHQVER
jgi:hypothetical protein